MSARLIIVRHGEAEGNVLRYFQGHTDGKISERGRLQLEALAKRFESIDFDAIYSSPLSRAMDTAAAANRRLNLPIHTDERLMEINGGVIEGMKWADFPVKYPEDAVIWNNEPHRFHPQGGESMTQVRERMSAAVLDIARENEGHTVVIASHGCAIRALFCWAHGWPIERQVDVAWWDNTGMGIIEIENGVPTVISENDCQHVGELSTFATQRWWKEPNKMVFDD